MTGSGRAVWDLLARPRTTEELVSALSERFAADPATIRTDVVALVARLAAAGALEELPGRGLTAAGPIVRPEPGRELDRRIRAVT